MTIEEGSEGEESVDELLRKMAEQPADTALQLRGLKAMRVRGSSADPHLAAAAIVAAMQAHPGDAALQLEACRAAKDHFTEKLEESEAEAVQAAVNLMEHGLIAHVQVTIRNHSHDHDLFDAAVQVLFVLYGIAAARRNRHVASEALLRGEDAAIVPLLLARMQDVAEAPDSLEAVAGCIAGLLCCYCMGGLEAQRALAAAGAVPRVLSCLEVLQDDEEFQGQGSNVLSSMASGPREVKDELLRAGAVAGLGAALQRALANDWIFTLTCCCEALSRLSTGISEDVYHKLQDPEAINAVCRVLRQYRSDRAARSPAVEFLLHVAELPTARHLLVEAEAIEALLLTGVRHEELFGSAAAALA